MFAAIGDKVTFLSNGSAKSGRVIDRIGATVSVKFPGGTEPVSAGQVLRIKSREDKFAAMPWRTDNARLPWKRAA